MNKKIISLLLLLSLGYTAKSQLLTPVHVHGQLSVENGKIVDKNHIEPQLRGISMSWSIWQGRKYYNPEVIRWLKKDFKITLLRVSMAVEPEGGYLQDPEGQHKLIIETIDEAVKNGIYVLVDWHDHHAYLHPQKAVEFFSKIAKRYVGKPNIIYEVYNEPERIELDLIKNYAVAVIKEIRKFDTKNLIVVGSPAWDQDVDVMAKNPITGFSNIAYSFHFYATEPGHQEGLMAKANQAINAGLPLFVTEWGVGEADGNGKFDLQKTEKWLGWMEKNKISWANWNITDKDETTALLRPGAHVSGNWKTDELTPAGKYIRTKLRELNP